MKKILLILLTISSNMLAKTYHFANDTDSEMEVKINFNTKVGSALFDEKLIVKPYSVAFHKGPWAKTPKQIVVRARYMEGILRDIEKTLNVNTDASYFAFHFIPTTYTSVEKIVKTDAAGNKIVEEKESRHKSFMVKQRINADAKFILEDHKMPASPDYYK